MPPIFKTLASITVWVLFVLGLLGVLGGLVFCGMRVSSVVTLFHTSIGVTSLILSVVAIKLRQMLQ